MSSGHILYYFRTKDELLLQTLEWSEERLGAERGPAARPAAARPASGSTRYVDLYVPDGHRDPHWTLWLEVWNRSQNADDDDPRTAARHRARLAPRPGGPARRRRVAGASSGPVDPDRFAARLRALLDGFSIHVAIGLRGTGREQILAHVREFLDGALTSGA